MRNEKVVYTCDDCQCEIREGFFLIGRVCSVKNNFEIVTDVISNEEVHYCKPCFKAKLGLKERATKDAAV